MECKTSAHTTDRGWLMSRMPDLPPSNLTVTDEEAGRACRASRTSASGADKLLTLSTSAFAFGIRNSNERKAALDRHGAKWRDYTPAPTCVSGPSLPSESSRSAGLVPRDQPESLPSFGECR